MNTMSKYIKVISEARIFQKEVDESLRQKNILLAKKSQDAFVVKAVIPYLCDERT